MTGPPISIPRGVQGQRTDRSRDAITNLLPGVDGAEMDPLRAQYVERYDDAGMWRERNECEPTGAEQGLPSRLRWWGQTAGLGRVGRAWANDSMGASGLNAHKVNAQAY